MLKLSPRRRAHLGLAAALAVLVASVTALLVVPRHSRPVAAADVGTLAPDFQLPDTTGQTVTLSQLRGQVVVLFFSSLNCPATAAYNERVEQLAERFAGDARVKFLAVNVGPQPVDPLLVRLDPQVAARSFSTLLDERSAVASRYSASVTPYIVVVDPRGEVRYRGPFDNNADLAFATRSYCEEALNGALSKSTIAVASHSSHARH